MKNHLFSFWVRTHLVCSKKAILGANVIRRRYKSVLLLSAAACMAQLSAEAATITGELRKWHKVTLTFDGPNVSESASPNPFNHYRLDVTFTNGGTSYVVPGYYAADGNAGETGATSGNKWRCHFAPDKTGSWTYSASFRFGANVHAGAANGGSSAGFFDGETGSFNVLGTNKTGRDMRAKGRPQYVGEHHLRFAETGDYFLKAGPDSPENFLAYDDFDGPFKTDGQGDNFIKNWNPHAGDWNAGDPQWQGTKGREMIGAINYLASEGLNTFSFLTMNINGDDKNVFPYTNYNERMRIDCSRMDQWEIVFNHATKKGMHLSFKTQETENNNLLDGGNTGNQRKLYLRELVARFGHNVALTWNLGEENTQSTAQQRAMINYIKNVDPYDNHIVVHTYPPNSPVRPQAEVYTPLLGSGSNLTGASIQINWNQVFTYTKMWIDQSAASGRKWVVANDEQNGPNIGVPPDSYTGTPNKNNIRKDTLWGNIMAGGAGVEYYFGYSLPNSDLTCQDYRSRNQTWDFCRHALNFFAQNDVPFEQMTNRDDLSTATHCLAQVGFHYLLQLKNGGSANLNLNGQSGPYNVRWYNPRSGGSLQTGNVAQVLGGGVRNIGNSPGGDDWICYVSSDDAPSGGSPVDFQFNSNNIEGWARSGSIEAHAFTPQGEYLVRAAPNSDPYIFNNGVSFSGSDTTEIRVRMKAQASGVIQLFWGTSQAGAGGFSANRVKSLSYPTANVYQELVFNMSGESAWIGKTITNLRVDTTTASTASHTWFDYIVGNGNGGGNPSGFVFLRKRSAIGFAMDGGAGGQNNQNVNMQGYNTSDLGQQWEEISRGNDFYTYKKRNTNFVLDGGAGPASNDDNVYLWAEGATNQNQHWKKIDVSGGYYRLEKRNANTHSIDGGGGAGFNGQNVKLWVNGNSNQNQHWRIE